MTLHVLNHQVPVAFTAQDGGYISYPLKGSVDPIGGVTSILHTQIVSSAGVRIGSNTPNSDAVSQSTQSLDVLNFNYHYDPGATQWERTTGNFEQTILASAARTASNNSADFINRNCRGMHLYIDVTAIVTAPSIVVTVQGKDATSAGYYDILVSPAITAVGVQILKIYPSIGAIANQAAADILPRTWRVSVAHANANSITYSIGANMVI